MSDYWLSKLFYDLQQPALGAAYRADRAKVIANYPLKPEAKAAALADDVAVLARLVNPYLLRYYFSIIGVKESGGTTFRYRSVLYTGTFGAVCEVALPVSAARVQPSTRAALVRVWLPVFQLRTKAAVPVIWNLPPESVAA